MLLVFPHTSSIHMNFFFRFLASGDLQRHIASTYRISKQHFGSIIDQVCDALNDALQFTVPQPSEERFIEIANRYNAVWNFPNCLGAIDGKHVSVKAPPKSGSMFYNYKVSTRSRELRTLRTLCISCQVEPQMEMYFFLFGKTHSSSNFSKTMLFLKKKNISERVSVHYCASQLNYC